MLLVLVLLVEETDARRNKENELRTIDMPLAAVLAVSAVAPVLA